MRPMPSLSNARRQEAAALAELLAGGQHLSQVLHQVADCDLLPTELRRLLRQELARYQAARASYDRASSHRAAARGESTACVPRTDQPAPRERLTQRTADRINQVRDLLLSRGVPQPLREISDHLHLPRQTTVDLLRRGRFEHRRVRAHGGSGSAVWWLPQEQ